MNTEFVSTRVQCWNVGIIDLLITFIKINPFEISRLQSLKIIFQLSEKAVLTKLDYFKQNQAYHSILLDTQF